MMDISSISILGMPLWWSFHVHYSMGPHDRRYHISDGLTDSDICSPSYLVHFKNLTDI